MHKEVVFKKISIALLVILLPMMLWMSTQASISGDEFLHRDQAEAVVDYFLTSGANQKALDTPVTNLKHYGQSCDNLASLIARVFKIENIFLLRHLMSAMAGWLVVLFAVLMAKKTGGWTTALFTIIILAVSARFMGHSLNNLKDIPFALGYMAGLYSIYNWISQWPRPQFKTAWLMVAAIAFSISIRPPGLILIAYLGLAVTGTAVVSFRRKELNGESIMILMSKTLLVMMAGYFAGLLFWPYALQNPLMNPIVSHQMMEAYPVTIRQLFMGEMIWSDMLPWYYLPWMMLISVPMILITGLLSLLSLYRFKQSQKAVVVLLFSILFPLIYIVLKQSNVYGGWRHILFIYPPLAIMAGYGLHFLYNIICNSTIKAVKVFIVVFIILIIAEPVAFMIRNHPFHYLYFNPLTGGYKGAFTKYEGDYYFNTIQPAAKWLNNHIEETTAQKVKIISNFEAAWHFRHNKLISSVSQAAWHNRNHSDWDYAVFSATYLHPHTLKNGLWPPPGTIYSITVDNQPVCVVVKRICKDDYWGWEALKKGNFNEAIENLDRSVEADPSNEGAWLDYGRALNQNGKHDEAIEKINRALAIHPLFEPALLEKARCMIKKRNITEALEISDFLLHSNIKYLPGWLFKTEILVESGKKTEAIKTLQKALIIQPSFISARERLLELTEKQ